MKAAASAAVVIIAYGVISAQQARFSSRSTGVVFEVAVLDNRELVRGLTAENFELEDVGVRQSITVRETADTPLDVVCVIQPLDSIRPVARGLAERDARAIFALLQPQDRAAVVLASTPPHLQRRLASLEEVPFSFGAEWRGTFDVALWDGLFLSYRQFDRQDRRRVVLAFSNTDNDAGVTGPRDVAALAELQPAQLFFLIVDQTGPDPIGVSQSVMPGRGGSTVTTTTYFTAVMKWRLPKAVVDLVEATGGQIVDLREGDANIAKLLGYLRAEYLITYTPTGVPPAGWHDVTIRLKGRRGSIVTRPGYWGSSESTSR